MSSFFRILKSLARPFRWVAQAEADGSFVWSLLAVDLLVTAAILQILEGFVWHRALDVESIFIVAAGVVLIHLFCLAYAHTCPARPWWLAAKLIVANITAVLVFPLVFVRLQIPLSRETVAVALALCTPLQVLLHYAHRRHRPSAPLEPLRWTLLACTGLLLGFPLLTSKTVGTGDAYWYSIMVGDFVTQLRAGVFPIFVGQSDFAFNGAVSPLRYAPYLQHAAGGVDLLTWHTLAPGALLNMVLVGSLVAAAFSSYRCLIAIHRGPRWIATFLAGLFVSCPGVLALVYTGDLFMSVCALPYLPLVFYGIWRTYERRDRTGVFFMVTALAALWLCHPPIGFWATLIAAFSQLLRLRSEGKRRDLWRDWLLGALLFLALSGSMFLSVWTLKIPALIADPGLIMKSLQSTFPGAFLPVSDGANDISDYQLGWSLWLVALLGAMAGLVRRRRFGLFLLTVFVALIVLLVPIPHVTDSLWRAMPQVVCNITFNWPMQRFYPLLAVMALFIGYAGWADLAARHWWVNGLLLIGLGFGLQWTAFDGSLFLTRGVRNTPTDAQAQLASRPENRILTRYSYSPLPDTPAYFSHGYVDPVWENRLLEPVSFRELSSNYGAIVGEVGTLTAEGPLTARSESAQGTFFALLDVLPIQPGRHYALEIITTQTGIAGSLLVTGPTLAREYYLPDSGIGLPRRHPSSAFGTLPSSKHSLPLVSSGPKTEKLFVEFISSTPVQNDITAFGSYRLREYDPTRLPVAIEGWMPFRARVNAPAAALLETPRMFVSGYRATVNDQVVPVTRSPDGLVMFPVPGGQSSVLLSYPGPVILRLGYYLSLCAWLAWLGTVAVCCARPPARIVRSRIPAAAR